jgi:hypothetical protein
LIPSHVDATAKGNKSTAFHKAKNEDKMELFPKASRKERNIIPAEIGTGRITLLALLCYGATLGLGEKRTYIYK